MYKYREDENKILTPGVFVKYFAYETLTEDEKYYTNKWVYEIIDVTINVDTSQMVVIYKALQGKYFVRSLKNFLSKVDKEKYPNIKQEYIFELF